MYTFGTTITSYRGSQSVNVENILCVYRDAQMIMEDIKRTISELEQESSLPAVGVELVDNELATLYMNSKKSEVNTSPYHPYHTQTKTRQCV